MHNAAFQLPVWFDLGATFAFALTGAIAAIHRGYDIVGVFFLALASGLGGGLIRDGVFISGGGPTPLLSDPRYIEVVVAATVAGALLGRHIKRFHRVIAVIDALGLGAYAAFGVQKSLHAGLAVPAAILVGVVNASGGGLLRDVLTGEEPLVFKPGQFYVLAAVVGAVAFVFFTVSLEFAPTPAAIASVALTFVFRMLSIVLNWRTAPVSAING
ncbi:MAG: TRIC cation channel family protein [Verrucomicrobia bacterium]|nr:TRIC cation channel family protein [Verrucomicrobiota bacterium]